MRDPEPERSPSVRAGSPCSGRDLSWLTVLFTPWRALPAVARVALQSFERLLDAGRWRDLVPVLVGVIVVWHIYTPIHELIHAFTCLATGGTVETLALKPRYGGHLLHRIFPFVVAESDYAGQLSGFSVPSYWAYALVDFAPYLLSLFGVACLDRAWHRRSSIWFSLGIVLALAPVMSITGDYYEAVSLVTTQLAERMDPSLPVGILVSDDVFALVPDLREAGYGSIRHALLIGLGLLGSVYLVLVTIAAQVWLADRVFRLKV